MGETLVMTSNPTLHPCPPILKAERHCDSLPSNFNVATSIDMVIYMGNDQAEEGVASQLLLGSVLWERLHARQLNCHDPL